MEQDFLQGTERRDLNTGRKSAAQIVAEMDERRRALLMADVQRARPYVDAAVAKRQRRQERNLRVAGVR